MSWSSITLADTFPNQYGLAVDTLAIAQAALNDPRLAEAEAKIQTMISESNALVSAAQAALDDLAGSGLYSISLQAGQGSWVTRFSSAPDAPPQGGSVYSAVMASIMVGADIEAIGQAYETAKASLTEPMKISAPDMGPLTKPSLIDEPEPSWMAENAWKTLTVGDLFPGQLNQAKAAMNEAQKALTLAQNAKSAFDAKKLALQEALTKAQAVVTAMGATGVYQVMLAPGAGDWMTRLQAEGNAPPLDSSNYCAGMMTVAQATDLSVVQEQWTKFSGALG